MLSSQREERRPLVVGVLHGDLPTAGPEEREALAREIARVGKVLSALPARSRVGLEMTPKELAELEERHPQSFVEVVASHARKLGHEVLPLEIEAGRRRHEGLADRLEEAIIRYMKSKRDEDYLKVERLSEQEHLLSGVRSAIMGRRILEHRPAVSVVGDSHAQELKPALGETHEFRLSPEAKPDIPPFYLWTAGERTKARLIKLLQATRRA